MSRRPAALLGRLRQLAQLTDPAAVTKIGWVCAGALLAVAFPGWGAAAVLWAGLAWVLADPVQQEWRARQSRRSAGAKPGSALQWLADRWVGLRECWLRIVLVIGAVALGAPSWTRSGSGTAPGPVAAPLWWAVLVGLLLCLALVVEQELRRQYQQAGPMTANLPAGELSLPSAALVNGLFWLNTAAVMVLLVTASFGLPPWVGLAGPLAAAGVAGALAVQVQRHLNQRRRLTAKLPALVAQHRPVFVLYWQAPAGSAYQVAMWLPYLTRLGVPFCVVVRTPANLAEVAELTDVPVLLRPGLADLDAVLCPTLRTVFYVNASSQNSQLVRFAQLTHIQLNHGDSDKVASVSPVFRQYDHNFVAGQAAIDRFAKRAVTVAPGHFEIVGRPQLERIDLATPGTAVTTVLYAPTWSGFYEDSDYSSLSAGTQIVQALLERELTVVFRPHPSARKRRSHARECERIIALLAADAAATGRGHLFGAAAESERSAVDCFNAGDAMIADVSSMVSDFLASGKPLAMAAVSAHGEQFRTEFPLARAAYVFDVVDDRVDGLAQALSDLLGSDPKRADRQVLRDYYLAGAPSEYRAKLFDQAVRRYL